jgi:hypothetical protein
MCSFTFMWGRMMRAYVAMADTDRCIVDPLGLIMEADGAIRAYWRAWAGTGFDGLSLHDSVLLAMTMPELAPRLRCLSGGIPDACGIEGAGEFFYLVAPLHIAFGCPALTAACLLNLADALPRGLETTK